MPLVDLFNFDPFASFLLLASYVEGQSIGCSLLLIHSFIVSVSMRATSLIFVCLADCIMVDNSKDDFSSFHFGLDGGS